MRGPDAATIPIIDAKFVVHLHLKTEWRTSFVLSLRVPYLSLDVSVVLFDDKIAVHLHTQDKLAIHALQYLLISKLLAA